MDIGSLLNATPDVVPMDLDAVVNPPMSEAVEEPVAASTTHVPATQDAPYHSFNATKGSRKHVVVDHGDDDEAAEGRNDADFMMQPPDEFNGDFADLPKPDLPEVGKVINITPDGAVTKKILKLGSAWEKPSKGDEVYVTYVGRVAGSLDIFDSNENVEDPFKFLLGHGMHVFSRRLGQQRRLVE